MRFSRLQFVGEENTPLFAFDHLGYLLAGALAMPPAARITDLHLCPQNMGGVPHVGGPILPAGEPTVLIGSLPAARVTDLLLCVGPPDMIAMGCPTVLIGYQMAARIGDLTIHGGIITTGCGTVLIGMPAQAQALTDAAANGAPLADKCAT